jgi:hypothetical protein
MLGKWPNPNRLSEMSAWARGLWIRRVLVHLRWPSARAQEGQLEGSASLWWCGAFFCFARCYRISGRPAARRLTSRTGDSITFDIVASSAC